MQTSQEYFTTIVYAKFGGQTECIMDNWKIVNGTPAPNFSWHVDGWDSMFELHISYNPRWLNLKEVLSYFKFVLKTLTPALRTTPRATLRTTQWTILVLSTCNKTLIMALSLGQECMRNGEICTIPRRTSTQQMDEIAWRTRCCIYKNCYIPWIDLSGWMESVCGLEADISLPHCLATGIWNACLLYTSPSPRDA